ncbi:hypothetical protein [Streptomyces sp. TRM64462]|uniref:hypothetical protein n=1 Tax=Streptomyces sp. TRM64462 TaxID=2741726 RepID=UPI001586B8E7|nr:hypothetical protein [Streptomyces sp. TRM64462]
MSRDHDEPVFVRRGGKYVYNHRNPVARVLMVVSLLLVGWLVYDMYDDGRWSDGELRDAVHTAARSMEAEPRRESYLSTFGYDSLIKDEIYAGGEGPEHSVQVTDAGGGTGTRFEVTTPDTDTAYCVSVSPPRPEGPRDLTAPDAEVQLSVAVAEGAC